MLSVRQWLCGSCCAVNNTQQRCTECQASIAHPKARLITVNKYTTLNSSSTSPSAPIAELPPSAPASSFPSSCPLSPPAAQLATAKRKARTALVSGSDEQGRVEAAAFEPSAARPKRQCVTREPATQQRMDALFKARKAAAASAPQPTIEKTAQQDAAATVQVASTSSLPALPQPPPPAPSVPQPVSRLASAATKAAGAARPAPPPAAFVPSTLPETVSLLQALHSSLSLSSIPPSPSALPSRSSQLQFISSFLSSHLGSRSASALYIAGRPGVGKTLTVDMAMQAVLGPSCPALTTRDGAAGGGGGKAWRYAPKAKAKAKSDAAALPTTLVVSLNAMAVKEGGGRFWHRLWSLLKTGGRGGQCAAAAGGWREDEEERQLSSDEARTRVERFVAATHRRREMIVLVVDEIDALLTSSAASSRSLPLPASAASSSSLASSSSSSASSTSLLHSLFLLVYSSSSCLLLLSISNNITLLDGQLASLSASCAQPERVVFSTYSQQDLLAILTERITRAAAQAPTAVPSSSSTFSPPSASPLPIFELSALEFVCKSVGKDTGDVRRCLRDCRQALQQLMDAATAASSASTPLPFSPSDFVLSVTSMSRLRAASLRSASYPPPSSLSPQQQHLLWALTVSRGAGGPLHTLPLYYRRCVQATRGALCELSDAETMAVADMLESIAMLRKERLTAGAAASGRGRGGKAAALRVLSLVPLERLRAELRGGQWERLWPQAAQLQRLDW